MAEGIEVRQSQNGTKSYRASVWSNREQRLIRKTFPTLQAAKAWRSEANTAVRAGTLKAAAGPTLEAAVKEWLAGAEAGTIRTRGRRQFKPATPRAVRQHYNLRLKEPFGRTHIDAITHPMLQEFVDKLDADGFGPSTIEGTILPLRLVYRWARGRGIVSLDPTEGLELPEKARGTRLPPSPKDAGKLLEAVPEEDRAMWATAMLAGLRRGELMGLRWEDVDLKHGRLSVERSYDPDARVFGTPKSRLGTRKVPIGSALAPYLKAHMLRTGRRSGLVFGLDAEKVQRPETVQKRADEAWKAAKLERVTLHACRHLYASMSIAAGVNAHALCKYMGHSGIQVTYDMYGHLFPGNEAEASKLLDAYLEKAFVA